MKAFLLAASLVAAPARAQETGAGKPAAAAELPKLLRDGRWQMAVGGVLCNACTKAIVEALREIPGVMAASFDYEDGKLEATVARGKQVRLAKVERALRLAGRRVDLDTRFTLTEARLVGPAPEPPKPAAPAPAAPKPAPMPQLPPGNFPEPTPE